MFFFLRYNMLYIAIINNSNIPYIFFLPVCICKLMGNSYIISTLYHWSLRNLRSLEMTLLMSHMMFYPDICFLFFRALRHRGRQCPACTRLTDLNRSCETWEKNYSHLATDPAVGLQLKGVLHRSRPWRSAVRGMAATPQEPGQGRGLLQPLSTAWDDWDASRCLASSAGC